MPYCMQRFHIKDSKAFFLWILLLGTTIVLVLVIFFFVGNRSAQQRGMTAGQSSTAIAAQEKEYTKEVRGSVLAYIAKTQKLDGANEKDRAAWKALATELHNQLLNIAGVPTRMHMIHLSMVLALSQTMAAFGTDQPPSITQHIDQLNTILLALQ